MPRHRTLLERRQLLDAFRDSGMTQRAFARQRAINVNTLRAWLYAERHGPSVPSAAAFLEVHAPVDAGTVLPFVVQIGAGPVLRFAAPPDATWLAQLVAAHPC